MQRALAAKGIGTGADGWYGNGTTSSYAAWQRRLGHSGNDANGLPGKGSLTTLGSNGSRSATRSPSAAATTPTAASGSTPAPASCWRPPTRRVRFAIRLTQGSYNAGGVGASAGPHDGGGVVDATVTSLTTTQRWQLVRALRTVGFAAWLRTPAQGCGYHVHAVAIGDPVIWQRAGGHVARDQVCDYYKGLNALAGHAADNPPSSYRVGFTWWERFTGI